MCQEQKFPGMWQRWYREQCVAVGWGPEYGYKLHDRKQQGKGWSTARNRIKEMEVGDLVVASLRGNRVGRLGTIVKKEIEDNEWRPLVPKNPTYPYGEMGRRILVRWDLTVGPIDQDYVVQIPNDEKFSGGELRPTVSKIRSKTPDEIRDVMNDSTNWVNLLGSFSYEKAISDFIANYPYLLEADLLPYPDSTIRERKFNNKKRLDVLLIDKDKRPVVVECKQKSPTVDDIKQLIEYMRLLQKESEENDNGEEKNLIIPRGILVHGGAPKLSPTILKMVFENPQIEIVSYRLNVNFTNFSRNL
jgi:RecB family endonuclease NucS